MNLRHLKFSSSVLFLKTLKVSPFSFFHLFYIKFSTLITKGKKSLCLIANRPRDQGSIHKHVCVQLLSTQIPKRQSSHQYLFALLASAHIKLLVECWWNWQQENKVKRELHNFWIPINLGANCFYYIIWATDLKLFFCTQMCLNTFGRRYRSRSMVEKSGANQKLKFIKQYAKASAQIKW